MSDTMKAVVIKGGKGPIENMHIGAAPMPKATHSQEVIVKVSLPMAYSTARNPDPLEWVTYA